MVELFAQVRFEPGDLLPVERAFDSDYAAVISSTASLYVAGVGAWQAHFGGDFKYGVDPDLPPGFPDGIVRDLWVKYAGFDRYTIVGVNVHSTVLNRLDGAEEVGEYIFRQGDRLIGSHQNDLLRGFGGNDVIQGKGGIDRLYGGDGNDRLDAGSGSGHLYGGEGEDTFVFTRAVTLGVVEDFEKGDRINLTSFKTTFSDLVLKEHRGIIVIELSENHRIDIAGDIAKLGADDFIF